MTNFLEAGIAIGVIAVGVALTGCSADAGSESASDAPPAPSETVAVAQDELASCGCTAGTVQFFQSQGFNQFTVGPSVNDWVCWAAEYDALPYGSTDDPNEWPYLHVYNNNVNWIVAGTGWMGCTKKCCFYSNHPDQDQILVSQEYAVTASVAAGQDHRYNSTDMWLTDAMALPLGIFHSGALPEKAYFIFGTDSGFLSLGAEAFSTASQAASTTTYALPFFVGVPHSGHVVKKTSKYYLTSTETTMISASAGICVLGNIPGSFHNRPGQYVAEWVGGGVWRGQNTFPRGLSSEVTCYYYDQDN